MSIANGNDFDLRCLALAKQCYHGTVHGSVLLKWIEFRPGKTVADLWGVIHSCDFLAAEWSRRFESEMQGVAARLAQIVVFPRQVEMSPVAQVVNLARTKGIAVEQDGPGSEEVLGEFARFLSRPGSRKKLAKEGINKVLESFPRDVFRSLAMHLAALLCPQEWQESLDLDVGADGQVIPGGSTAKALIRYIEHEGGRRVLAKKGIAALVERFRAAGGEIQRNYAAQVASDKFPDEYAAGKAAVKKVRASKPRSNAGISGRFLRFMEKRGGATTLAEQGFDACLAAYERSGGAIERAYARHIVSRRYPPELLAGQKLEKAQALESPPAEGLAGGFAWFLDTQGGAGILAEQGFDACLAEYLRRGGQISPSYAQKIVSRFYRGQRPAAQSDGGDGAGPKAQ